ncbi:MAG: methyltransferase domain-containing protein [Candidatus Micrarchaeota archaeon]|nr:methyltransferase domain-containing protein [Candidatus Micrarchaeota archaeon]
MGLLDSLTKNGNGKPSLGFAEGRMDEKLLQIPFVFRYIRQPPAKVLEIGCSESLLALQLAALKYNVYGIDYLDYGFSHNNLKLIKDDFGAHDFGKDRFDVIIVMNAVEHFGLQYYKRDEPLDKQADVKAMTKVKEIINPGGQLLFASKYGISDLITKDGRPYERVYDDKALDVLLSTFQIKNTEYYMLSNYNAVRQVEKQELIGTRHYENTGTYGFICINAMMP